MAEKIIIGELDLNVKDLIKEAAQAKKAIADLRAENKELAKSEEDQTEAIVKNEAQIKKLSAEYRTQQNTISQLVSSNGELLDSTEAIQIAIDKENTSINAARANNAELTKLRNELNLSTQEGRDALVLINEQIDKNNDFIKENSSELEKQKIGIGGYADGIKSAVSELGLFNGVSGQAQQVTSAFSGVFSTLKTELAAVFVSLRANTTATQGLSTAQKAAVVTTNALSAALKLFRIALISTGIGAIVVVLGSLIAFLTTTQEGIDKVTSVTRPLQAVFQTLIGVLQDVGKFLFEAFSRPKQTLNDLYQFVKNQIIRQFQAFGKILEGIFTLDFGLIKEGFQDLADQAKENLDKLSGAANEFGNRMKEAIRAGAEIDRLQKEIEKQEIDIISLRAQNTRELKEQEQIARDTTKSQEERLAAVAEQIRLQTEVVQKENEILDLQIKQLEIKQSLNDSSREDLRLLEELRAKRIENDNKITEVETRNLRVVNQIRSEIAREAQQAQQARVRAQISELEQNFALLREERRFAQNRLEVQQEFALEEIKILDTKLKNKLISETEYNTAVLKIQQDLQVLREQEEQKELERIKVFEDKRRALVEQLELENAANEEEKAFLKAEQDFQRKLEELENLQLNEEEKTELLLLLEEQRENQLADLRERFNKAKIAELEKVTQAEIKAQETANNEQINMARQFTSLLNNVLGNSLAGRLAMIAIDAAIEAGRVALNTASAQAINLANATAASQFDPRAIARAISQNETLQGQSTAAIGRIIASAAVRGISTSMQKFEKGGIVGIDGKSHAQGGVPIYAGNQYIGEAEGNEGIGILNKGAFRSFMDFNNRYGNGRMGTTFANQGGIMSVPEREEMNIERILRNMPPPIVYVDDIKTGVSTVNEIEVMANV